MADTKTVYVDSNGKAGSIQFPLVLAGAVVTVDEDDTAPAAPNRSATKGDWVSYAVSVGATEADAEAMTRDELADTYGA
jgi:hypothetical protein